MMCAQRLTLMKTTKVGEIQASVAIHLFVRWRIEQDPDDVITEEESTDEDASDKNAEENWDVMRLINCVIPVLIAGKVRANPIIQFLFNVLEIFYRQY